ncbi:MAG: pilus assembly protein TadG-related protein [Candidatus Limnocylindrales bacterium]
MVVLFALSLVAMLLVAGLVIDGGYAYAKNRATQNAADFAAMAGTRIIGEQLTGNTANGTAANVTAAIQAALTDNEVQLENATYINEAGISLGSVVGAGTIPSGANGVIVNAKATWRPFFLGIIGVNSWSAGSTATATTPGSSTGGGVLPVGLSEATYDGLVPCPVDQLNTCVQQHLTSGALNIPGGFGWLKFGATGKCAGFGLGMSTTDGCDTSQPFLQREVGPPPNSYGCCGPVGQPGSLDFIGSLTGNKPADLSYYIQNEIPVWVPIWDIDNSQGANGYYHIVGFGAVIFVGEDTQHGKWLTGAAVSGVGCDGTGNAPVPGTSYCKGPGGAFTIGVTGAVHLVH